MTSLTDRKNKYSLNTVIASPERAKQSRPLMLGLPRPPINRGPRNDKGFTFVEIMVTLAVLSFGLVVIYQSFLICVNALSYYSTSLEVQQWLDEKTWEINDNISRTKNPLPSSSSGTFTARNKPVSWQWDIQSLSKDANGYQIKLSCFWKEGQRQIDLFRTFYAGALPEPNAK